jgi:hypothetical protein
MLSIALHASDREDATTTPFPAASPLAFTTNAGKPALKMNTAQIFLYVFSCSNHLNFICCHEVHIYLLLTLSKTELTHCLRRDTDKPLAFPICSTTKRIFLGGI